MSFLNLQRNEQVYEVLAGLAGVGLSSALGGDRKQKGRLEVGSATEAGFGHAERDHRIFPILRPRAPVERRFFNGWNREIMVGN